MWRKWTRVSVSCYHKTAPVLAPEDLLLLCTVKMVCLVPGAEGHVLLEELGWGGCGLAHGRSREV